MLKKYVLISFLALALVVGVGAGTANATLTLDALTATSSGALTLDGAAASAITVGSATTTGNIAIGGALTTGTLTLGKTTQTGITVISGSTNGANTLFDNVAGGTIAIGVANTGGINIGAGNTAKTIAIGTGTAIDTINIGTGATGVDVIRIGQAAADLALTDAQWSITSPGVATFVNGLVSASATLGLDVGAAGNLQLGGVNATTIGLGNGSMTALTVTSSTTGTGTVVLPTGAISTAEILDDTVGVADLAASLTFADADLVSFASVSVSSSTEGLILPQHATDCSTAGTAEGQVCWEADANVLYIGDGTTVAAITPNTSSANTWTNTNAFNGATVTIGDAATDLLTITSTIQGASPLVFEALTANDFELTIAVPDVGADATITLPSATGTLATLTGTETLTNKTLTSPVLTTPDLGTPSALVLTSATGLPAASVLAGSFGAGAFVISTSLQSATYELGHATDTTLSRVSAGLIAVEGVNVVDVSTAQTLTTKTLTAPVINGATSASGNFNLSGSTGTFLTPTGAVTIGSGAISITGDATVAAGKRLIPDTGAATSTAGAATISNQTGQITTEALTTAAAATYTMTLTNTLISATSKVMVSVGKGTATTGSPVVTWVTPGAGSAVIIIQNVAAAAALNGTITINFAVFN